MRYTCARRRCASAPSSRTAAYVASSRARMACSWRVLYPAALVDAAVAPAGREAVGHEFPRVMGLGGHRLPAPGEREHQLLVPVGAPDGQRIVPSPHPADEVGPADGPGQAVAGDALGGAHVQPGGLGEGTRPGQQSLHQPADLVALARGPGGGHQLGDGKAQTLVVTVVAGEQIARKRDVGLSGHTCT
jgi:hypothetical protein